MNKPGMNRPGMNKPNTACGIFLAQIDDLLDNELAPAERQSALAHLRTCPDCAGEYLLARDLRDAMLDLPQPELPPALLGRVLAEAERLPPPWRERMHRWFAASWLPLALPAMGTAALAGVAAWFWFASPAPIPAPPQIAVENPVTSQELMVAIEDLNTTITTLNEITESMQIRLGDRMLNVPVFSLPALSIDPAEGGEMPPAMDDPI